MGLSLALEAMATARTREIEAANIALRSGIAEREGIEALLHQPHRAEAVG